MAMTIIMTMTMPTRTHTLYFLTAFQGITMFGLGTPEILLIAVVLVLLFGAKKIPELMRGLGSGVKEFKKSSSLEDEKDEKKP